MMEPDLRDENPDLMTPADRKELLFDIIQRFDFYINSTNTKASLVLAWNGIVIGTVLLKYDEILQTFSEGAVRSGASIGLVLIGLGALISNLIVFRVVFPFLDFTSKPQAERKLLCDESIFYFGSVAKLDSASYMKTVTSREYADILKDLTDQIVTVGRGLDQKMKWLRHSLWFIGGELFVLASLIVVRVIT